MILSASHPGHKNVARVGHPYFNREKTLNPYPGLDSCFKMH